MFSLLTYTVVQAALKNSKGITVIRAVIGPAALPRRFAYGATESTAGF